MKDDLIIRAIFNVKKKKNVVNWVHIMNIFGVGSTRAKDMCIQYNINPESVNLHDRLNDT